jgi:hypothetical protein
MKLLNVELFKLIKIVTSATISKREASRISGNI